MPKTRTVIVVLGALGVTSALVGCRQVSSAWQSASCVYERTCTPPPGPPATVDPVYDVGGGTGAPLEGRGAFATPRR